MVLKLKKLHELEETPPQPESSPEVSPVENNDDLPAGTELHGYSILKKLGSGGMGTVYLAEQKSMRRQIALKILNPSVTKDASSVEQFLNEVRNTGQIHHPNIVNAFDAGCENGIYFLAMQYIKGDTLDQILQEDGSMEEIRALELTAPIAGALSHVWNKYEMFHRDIKPGNIMFDREENKAMLMDLGIAQKLGEDGEEEDSVKGSPLCMSPEQILRKKLSWTTDLYSLGVTLYQLIVGVPPYDDKVIENILQMHCQADFPNPSERNPGCKISDETVALLKKMMDKNPGKRFASWEAFTKELEELIALLKDLKDHPEKRTVLGAMALAESKRKKQQQAKRKTTITTFVIFLLIIGAAAGGYWYLATKNTQAAMEYLTEGGGKGSKLQEAFEKFKADPSKFEDFKKILKQAELSAKALGVPSDKSSMILAQVDSLSKESQELYDSYEAFKLFVVDFEKRSKDIEAHQAKIGKKIPTRQECTLIADLIANLESITNAQRPRLRVQKTQLDKFKAAIAVMKQKAEQNYARLKKAEKDKADAVARRSSATVRRTDNSDETFDFSEVDGIVQGQVNAAENKKRDAARKQQDQDRKALNDLRIQANRSSAPNTKPAAIKLLNGADALTAIRKDTQNLKKLFFDAIYKADLDAAYNIRINPVYQSLPQTPDIKRELAKLTAEYNKYHAPVAKAYEVWKALNDLNNLGHFQQMVVGATDLNMGLGRTTLTIEKITDGKVYFLESGAIPVPFVNLLINDKNDIVRKLFSVKRFDQEAAYCFCNLLGLYEVAYEIAPKALRSKVINEAKTTVREHYREARKRNDYATMRRLERDYKNLKIMKGVF